MLVRVEACVPQPTYRKPAFMNLTVAVSKLYATLKKPLQRWVGPQHLKAVCNSPESYNLWPHTQKKQPAGAADACILFLLSWSHTGQWQNHNNHSSNFYAWTHKKRSTVASCKADRSEERAALHIPRDHKMLHNPDNNTSILDNHIMQTEIYTREITLDMTVLGVWSFFSRGHTTSDRE